MTVDCLICGGLVCDGTGSEPKKMDVGIISDKIAALAADLSVIEARERIDAAGMVVSPGFIDAHTHDDFSVFITPDMDYKVRQGVTTSIAGNCGFSVAPYAAALEQTILYHEKDKMPVWEGFSSYLDCFRRQPASINIGLLAGLGAFRYAVNKDAMRPLDTEEIARLRRLIEQGFTEGVLGLSLGLAYFPGTYSNTRELIDALEVMKGYNSLFAIHMRDEGNALIPALEETLKISQKSEVPVHISHFKALGKDNFHHFDKALELTDRFHDEYGTVTVDFYPFDSGSTALKETIRWNIFSPEKGEPMFATDAAEIVIVSSERQLGLIGRNIQELADERHLTAEETAREIVALEDNVLVAMRNCISEDNIVAAMARNYSMIGSDGIPTKTGYSNPRLYGTFPRVLGRFSRDKKVISLARAVYKMTGFPAARFGLKDRGAIREGAAADIVVFDYDVIADKADYSNPKQFPVGIRDVFVNGARVLKNGVLTGERSGRPLAGE